MRPFSDNKQMPLDVQKLWEKQEEVAMHFNDLLIKLRTQALAGITAIGAVVTIFGKNSSETRTDWLVAGWLFVALGAIWIAVASLDICYYNRLLIGAVSALLRFEDESKAIFPPNGIQVSTEIHHTLKGQPRTKHSPPLTLFPSWGIVTFYAIVLLVIVTAACLTFHMYCTTPVTPRSGFQPI